MKKLFFVTLLIQFNFIQSDYSVHPRADFVVNELVNSMVSMRRKSWKF